VGEGLLRLTEFVMSRSDLVDISGEIRLEREKAYLFFDGVREVWLAKSQCQWDPDDKVMTMPEWIALDKELI
jgi:hypothetical protein